LTGSGKFPGVFPWQGLSAKHVDARGKVA